MNVHAYAERSIYMKKGLKVTILLAVLIVGIIGTSTVAFAGENFKRVTVSTQWTTIASTTGGFGCNIKIKGDLMTLGARIDVRMLGKDGQLLWEESNSCPGLGSRVYDCGADVYTIQVKVKSGVSGTAIAMKTTDPVD